MLAGQTDGRDMLANGTILRDYTVEAVLGRGGFGIVYKARHNEVEHVVAIKEYLPAELAVRDRVTVRAKNASCKAPFTDGLRRFRDETKALIDFQNHPNIVDCRDFFRLNGIAILGTDDFETWTIRKPEFYVPSGTAWQNVDAVDIAVTGPQLDLWELDLGQML